MTGRTVAAALVFALLAAAACGDDSDGENSEGQDSEAPETIELMVFGEPEEVQAYRDLVEAFEEEQDDVEVELVVTADRVDLLTRVSTSISAGTPPDLFLVNYRFYGQYAATGALEPLEDRIADSESIRPDDYYPEAMEAFQWEGEQLCMPQNVSSLVTYYNRDLFEAAGVVEPGPDWSWDQMVEAAHGLTADSDGDGQVDQHGLGVEPGIVRLAPFVWSSGGELFDDPVAPTGYTIDTPEALLAVQDFLSLAATEKVVPSDEEMESEDLESRFLNGRLGMLLSSRRAVPVLRSNDELNWEVAPLPARDERVNILHSDAYCMTSDSDHHDEAWRFLEFAMSEEGQLITVATGRTVPSLKAVAESDAFLDDGELPENDQVYLDAIPGIGRLPTISTWPEIEDISDAIIEEAMFEVPGGEAVEMVTVLRSETEDAFSRATP